MQEEVNDERERKNRNRRKKEIRKKRHGERKVW